MNLADGRPQGNARGKNGLLLKAQQGSNGFFISQEMQGLHVDDPLHAFIAL